SVPNALDVMRQVRQTLGDRVLLGAGTVLDPETARAVLLAGAEYVVAPTLNLEVIRLCQRYDKLVMPGAFTPTEILAAWEAAAATGRAATPPRVADRILTATTGHRPMPSRAPRRPTARAPRP